MDRLCTTFKDTEKDGKAILTMAEGDCPIPIIQLRQRGDIAHTDQLATKAVVKRTRIKLHQATASERVIRVINQRERLAFAEQALQVARQARAIKEDARRLKALEMASELAVFAEGMPVPRSRREELQAVLKPRRGRAETPDVSGALQKLAKQAERTIRDRIRGFASKKDQRTAIAARDRLSTAIYERGRGRDIER